MRILLTSPTYPPFNSGLGNAVAQQAACLARAGHEVVVATGGGCRSSREAGSIRVETFNLTGADCWLQPIRGDVAAYTDFLFHNDWDVVLLNAWQNWATDIALKYLDEITARKFVYSHCISTNIFFLHQPLRSLVRYLAWRPYWWRLKKRMKHFDGIIFLADDGSDSRVDDLRLAKRCKIPISIVPNALSQSALVALKYPPRDLAERNALIAVGSYHWQKGFDFVIRAYAHSNAKKHFPLHVFGQEYTTYTDDLRKLVKQLGLQEQEVVFHEGISGDQLVREYANAALILSGSHTECQPLVLVDAHATGTPFIARSTGCINCMKGGIGVGTWLQMSKQIDKILLDKQIWYELVKEGVEAAVNIHSPNQVGSHLIKALTEIRDA